MRVQPLCPNEKEESLPPVLLAIASLTLLFIVLWNRRQRNAAIVLDQWADGGRLSVEEIQEVVDQLSETLDTGELVTAPVSHPDSSHIWTTPAGAQVYIN